MKTLTCLFNHSKKTSFSKKKYITKLRNEKHKQPTVTSEYKNTAMQINSTQGRKLFNQTFLAKYKEN